MTHQNHQTNGASLEDCHTNFFALTDLCGIKWRKFVNGERVNVSSDPLDDPILRSYSRCMQADILCVWRRIQSTKQENSDPNALFEISSSKVHPPLSLAAAKELWIFWYGEEPDLSELVDAELLKVAANQALWNGTWERGLTYECRSLLFKALHNLMERFVLTKDIVRFGKWFVQPCTSNDRLFGRSSQHLSFSFTFFVHGDTVCASIDLREHPAVRPLTKEHLTEAAAAFAAATNSQTLSQSHEHGNITNLPEEVASPHSNNGGNGDGATTPNTSNSSSSPRPRRVILAPFGMAATLTGNSFKATDPTAEKILEDWASFFPLCNKENSDVPPVVEVVSGGHKMYHPSIYVLVTDLDDMEEMEAAASQKGSLGTTSSAEAAALAAISAANSNEYAGGGSRKPTSHHPGGVQQQQQQMHAVTTVTTTTVATSSSQGSGSGSNSAGGGGGGRGLGSNSSIAMVEQRLHNLTASVQPHYDTTASSFTGSTTNTHASPQAATEMPERVWQDCITNTLHVAYAASVATSVASTGVTTGAAGCNISSHPTNVGGVSAISGTTATGSSAVGGDDCNSASSGNNRNSENNGGGVGGSGSGCSAMDTQNANTNTSDMKDIKDINGMETKLRMQQLQFWGFVDPLEKAPCTCTKTLNPASMTPHDTPHGGASTYSRNSVGDLMPVPSVGSPGTPAQSPHPNSTLSQPTSVPPADQLMTMSPRAPPSVPNLQQPPTPIDHLLDKNTPAPTPTDQHDNKSITTSPYVRPTPSVEPPPSVEGMGGLGPSGPGSVPQPPSVGRCTPTITSQQQQQVQQSQQQGAHSQSEAQMISTSGTPGPQCGSISIKKFELHQPALTPLSSEHIKTEPGYGLTSLASTCSTRNGLPEVTMASGISAADAINDYWKSFKTPDIKVKDIDSFANDDCSKFDVLYDFTFQNAWANHPMKRFKLNEAAKPCRSMCTKNLYEGHTHSKPLMPSPGSVYGSQLLSIDASLNPLCGSAMDAASVGGSACGGLVGIAAHGCNMANTNDSSKSIDGNGSAGGYFQSLDIQTSDALQGTASPCKEGKISASGNLYTAEGLNPTMNDLEQLFETSNDECGSVQIHTPPDSNNPSNGTTTTTTIDDLKRSTAVAAAVAAGAVTIAALQNCSNTSNASNTLVNNSNNSGGGTGGPGMIQAEDLTKMFPTPPSHEQHHPNSSPCQMDIQMTDLSVITASTTMSTSLETGMGSIIKFKQEYSVELGSPIEETIEDWSYVYRPPKRAKFVGSSKYAPLTNLPSQTLPPLSINCTYKPSWTTQKSRAVVAAQAAAAQQQQQLQQQQLQQQHQQLHELLSAAPRTPLQQPRTPLGPIPSPMHSNTVPTPLSSGGGGNNLLLNQLNCPQAALTNTPGSASMQQMLQRAGMSPISPAPASVVPFPMMQPQRHPPPPYEMAVASPATSTSSYLNKQYHSQEHPPTPQSVGMPSTHLPRPLSAAGNLLSSGVNTSAAAARELPEVSSLIVNILLYDTALNVFRDHNFDSSTVCVCNADSQKVGNIRGADSGVYVPLPGGSFNPLPPSVNVNGSTGPGGVGGSSSGSGGGVNMRMISTFSGGSALDSPASLPGTSGHTGSGSSSSSNTPATNQHINGYVDDDPVDCTCGFSAVVNRRLAFRAGLFYEDEMEITGVAEDPGRYKKQSLPSIIANLATALMPSGLPFGTTSLPTKGGNALVPAAEKAEKGNHTQPDAQALQNAHIIFDLLLEQCSIIQTSSSSINRAMQRHRHRLARHSRQPKSVAAISNVLEFVDANDVICLALEQARLAFENDRMDVGEFAGQHQLSPFHSATPVTTRRNQNLFASRLTVHKWPYIPVGFSRSNKEIVRTMNFIQPMLQNAFHSKSRSAAGSKDATYTVSGPLTWRQFHRLAGRASGQCEPQPIPSVIVGHDKDWVSVAPLAIQYWDKFLLEPYSYARDIVYLVVCPETDFVVDNTRVYFRELGSTYEMCKLGRHTPIRGWDGLLTVGPRTPTDNSPSSTPLDDWLRTLDDSQLAEKIRLYASAFHNQIVPYLNRIPGDKTLLNPPEHSSCQPGGVRERGTTSPTGAMSTIHGGVGGVDPEKAHNSPKMEGVEQQQHQQQQQQQQQQHQHHQQQQQQQSSAESADMKPDIKADIKPPIVLSDPLGMGDTMEDINPPAIVLYIVEPFTFGSDSPELERLACIALLRCYAELLKSIPESVRANINIQIISLDSILELGRSRSRKRFSDEIRCLALNIFSQCRRHLVHTQAVKSLTGFGTAANMEAFLKSKDEKNRQPYKMYTPPYVLAPMHEKNDKTDFSRQSSSMRALNEQKYSVMYCNYCLSEDQSWLLATVTDDRGEMFEKIIININVPNRTRRRKAPARRVGLKKLMDFIMGLISQTAHPWRLVVGRIGRIGHSELKSWSSLLSKQNLQKASKQLKDICKQCSLMYPPGILSACLVTLEPDSKLRVMPDQFTPDERFSQISMQNPLSTPQDVTCTHILVFPTSAVCLSFTRQFQNEPQVDLENDFLNFDEEDENEGFTDADLMGDLLDWDPQPGRMLNHCSPDRMEDNRSWQSAGGNNFNSAQQQDVEEVGSINQQPLAVGYMVSTAPTGRMPSWFWAACPHLEDVCPVFLKTALHLHVPNIQTTDDILNSTNAHSSATDHPLDSSLTADVLRFVLEGYNALSWLALDSNTHDRLSCLPINVQMLMDLYYLTSAIM
ncbi:mediator of RNA polymerase II transcription subunit 13 [Anastrepha obliqua]|uniref:mediator of RNA polymerase II transcription subunit 13 n=1 Tax=Anastrepha obliqua TaxID=95512 RepID=UPI00240A73D2|nr:mediator of RNA polymerase II transcription subunit 13 [Anastrepha obliqua]XP_054732385.1 mediator of RNA polymerase II transcription subunit 13 [Anastrepha obliqua]XP_054732386.1 mediator of RNA polymerase II transcription subunit 13 [Anastrepha obliqua]XP_054732387.1 mediator of RNA polymerase II transcription subunit 13 [Anastrepha obliqua]XP_054732388.1 mediator of RNA polymerase II transcription subunit 13 [Anastrepha obliqua]XP_054732389.1 mediator of RNA polymerase II transcription s